MQAPNGKPPYRAARRPSPEIARIQSPEQAPQKLQKIILSRQNDHDYNIHFVIATRSGGVDIDTQLIPLSEILDHVTPAELERFENRDYEAEDQADALRPPPKSRGRPRKGLHHANLAARGDDSREQSSTSDFSLPGTKPRGRPPKFAVAVQIPSLPTSPTTQPPIVSSPTAILSPSSVKKPSISIQVPSPIKPQQVAVSTPAFNGPEPLSTNDAGELDDLADSSEDQLSSQPPIGRPQYSMVRASGLVISETSADESSSSREASISQPPSLDPVDDQEPTPKRRRLSPKEDREDAAMFVPNSAPSTPEMEPTPKGKNQISVNARDLFQVDTSTSNESQSDVDGMELVEAINIDPETARQALLDRFRTTNTHQNIRRPASSLQSHSRISEPKHEKSHISKRTPMSPRTKHQASHFAQNILKEANGLSEDLCTILKPLSDSNNNACRPVRRVSLTPAFPLAARKTMSSLHRSPEKKSKLTQSSSKQSSKRNSLADTRRSSLTAAVKITVPPPAAPAPATFVPKSSTSSVRSAHTTSTTTAKPDSSDGSNTLTSRLNTFKPMHDISQYFRPLTSPKKPLPIPLYQHDSDSEDPLAQSASRRTSKSTTLKGQPQSRRKSSLTDPDDSGSYRPHHKISKPSVHQKPQNSEARSITSKGTDKHSRSRDSQVPPAIKYLNNKSRNTQANHMHPQSSHAASHPTAPIPKAAPNPASNPAHKSYTTNTINHAHPQPSTSIPPPKNQFSHLFSNFYTLGHPASPHPNNPDYQSPPQTQIKRPPTTTAKPPQPQQQSGFGLFGNLFSRLAASSQAAQVIIDDDDDDDDEDVKTATSRAERPL